jgi:hypothetical protein
MLLLEPMKAKPQSLTSWRTDDFYKPSDAARLSRTLNRLAKHDLSSWALTGGTAIELHLREKGVSGWVRPLHDLDFVASNFDCLPEHLGETLLFNHVHPHDPPAKCMLQAVDAETAVRIDVFRAYGYEMERTRNIKVQEFVLRVVALDDLIARHARLCCDLLRGQPVAPKFAGDFLRMVRFAGADSIGQVWIEHRKPDDPEDFVETTVLLSEAIASQKDLLIAPTYSTDVDLICERCESTEAFRLAEAKQIYNLLGYR